MLRLTTYYSESDDHVIFLVKGVEDERDVESLRQGLSIEIADLNTIRSNNKEDN